MMRLTFVFTAGLLAFLIVIVLYSLSYPFEARLFPWVIGIPATILMLIQLIREVSHQRHVTQEEGPSEHKGGNSQAYGIIIAWMAGFLAMSYVLGFLVCIPLFLFLYLKTNGHGWFQSLGLAVGMIVFIYGIFSLVMNMSLYPGILFS